jgi:hypothetical protein
MTRTYGVAADYVGREFDLLALQGAQPVGDVLLQQTLFSNEDAGEVCTGVQKLAQRWVLHFLTERASMPYNQEDGTDFMTDARRGVWQTEEDIQEAYDFASADVTLYMLRDENNRLKTTPLNDEDKFDSAELLALALLPDRSVSLTIQINSVAGTSRRVILPIPFSPITTGV